MDVVLDMKQFPWGIKATPMMVTSYSLTSPSSLDVVPWVGQEAAEELVFLARSNMRS